MMVMTAVGGDNQSTTVEGRERYGINVRYARDYREDLQALRRVLLPLPGGQGQIPMEEIADVVLVHGPSMIRDENGLLAGYVYVDFDTSKVDIGSYVEQSQARGRRERDAADRLQHELERPVREHAAGEGAAEAHHPDDPRAHLRPALHEHEVGRSRRASSCSRCPFSAVGAVWLLWALDYNISIAVWVGMIALMGLDAETGVFMLLFLDLSHEEYKKKGLLHTRGDLVEAIIHGAVKRVRPKAMTVFAAMLGLLPIMWSTGTGADLMKRIAAPMVGGSGDLVRDGAARLPRDLLAVAAGGGRLAPGPHHDPDHIAGVRSLAAAIAVRIRGALQASTARVASAIEPPRSTRRSR